MSCNDKWLTVISRPRWKGESSCIRFVLFSSWRWFCPSLFLCYAGKGRCPFLLVNDKNGK